MKTVTAQGGNSMRDRWSNANIILHWSAAMLIVGLASAGFIMTDLPRDSSFRLLMARMHTLGGATLMLLTVARLVVRLRGPSVTPLPLPEIHRRGIGVIHTLLYLVTFAIGASGFATGAQSTWPDYLRGQLVLAPELHELASREAHELLVFALIALVLLHVGGVMLQQIRIGGVLERMLPTRAVVPGADNSSDGRVEVR